MPCVLPPPSGPSNLSMKVGERGGWQRSCRSEESFSIAWKRGAFPTTVDANCMWRRDEWLFCRRGELWERETGVT